jgi:6-phosphogluconolactonase/glucosamine-6-phosphate isomerase/deaminase
MKVHSSKDYEEVSETAADWLLQRIRKNPVGKIGIATGNSTLGMYRSIARTGNQYTKSLSLFQLDEWVGLTEQQHSCRNYIEKEVRIPWGIGAERAHYFAPAATLLTSAIESEAAAGAMQKELDSKGPLDILILGMGKNGHLGFIEPGDQWPPDTCYVSELALSTQNHQMINQEQAPPKLGVTMGIKAIVEAKEILFIVTGAGKTAVYAKWLKKDHTPKLPASILWKHPNVSLVTDL